MAKKILFTFELEPGMITADDIFRPNGTLLIPKHTTLNDLMIAKLPLYNIIEVAILDGPIEKTHIDMDKIVEQAKKNSAAKQMPTEVSSYAQKVKSSEEFKSFHTSYYSIISMIDSDICDFIAGKAELDTEKLIDSTLSLLQGSSIHIFDMLHNIQVLEDSVFMHSINVALIAVTIGKWVALPENDIRNLALAGLLHDIGKTTIPDELLNKPGKLTDEEFDIIRSHPKRGYDLIREAKLDVRIKEACLLHHERCDGSGYPFALSSNKISPYAKIIAIADVYDAMTSPRSYRPALCPFKAIQIFESDGLYKYDPKFIMTFLEHIGAAYLNNKVLLNDGRTGEIVMLNKLTLSKPMIKCENEFIDLSRHPELSIESII